MVYQIGVSPHQKFADFQQPQLGYASEVRQT